MQRIHLEDTTKASQHVFDPGKLQYYWTSPFIICIIYPHGAIETENPKNGDMFNVNDQRLKPFLELEPPEIEEVILDDPVYQD